MKFLRKFSMMSTALCMLMGCSNAPNVFLGKWKSLWHDTDNKNLDLDITFEKDNSFHIEVYGGGAIEKIEGKYRISKDTFFVKDDLDEPVVRCNYADTGVYLFSSHGDSMFFKTVNDNCEPRKLTLEIGLVRSK